MIFECKKVKFYASYDKDAFFEYRAKIKSVVAVKGKKDSIYVTIENLTDDDLYNLVGLFRRYKVKMDSLGSMLNESHKELFDRCKNGHHINIYPSSLKVIF
jgi:hypothetical protein